jgi:hypothetical protein
MLRKAESGAVILLGPIIKEAFQIWYLQNVLQKTLQQILYNWVLNESSSIMLYLYTK